MDTVETARLAHRQGQPQQAIQILVAGSRPTLSVQSFGKRWRRSCPNRRNSRIVCGELALSAHSPPHPFHSHPTPPRHPKPPRLQLSQQHPRLLLQSLALGRSRQHPLDPLRPPTRQ